MIDYLTVKIQQLLGSVAILICVGLFLNFGIVGRAEIIPKQGEIVQYKATSSSRLVPDQLIVKFKPGQDLFQAKNTMYLSGYRLYNIESTRVPGMYKVDLKPSLIDESLDEIKSMDETSNRLVVNDINQAIKTFEKLPEIDMVQGNSLIKSTNIPNDTFFSDQWGLNSPVTNSGVDIDINAPEAWNISTGSANTVIAVIDSGIALEVVPGSSPISYTNNAYPDLNANLLKNLDGTIKGYDFVRKDNQPEDENGHGTHVSGIIAGVYNNNLGIAGVCPGCKIMPLKFMNSSGLGTSLDAIQSVYYAADNGADVINASWGDYYYDNLLQQAFDYAAGKGVVSVAAAGNENSQTPFYPASMRNVISVSGIALNGNRASFSNYGSSVEIAAPADAISTFIPGKNLSPICGDSSYSASNDGFGICYGTSMAAPMVAGCAGLMKSYNPNINQDEVESSMKLTAKDLGATGRDIQFGYGLLNCSAAMQRCDGNIFKGEFFRNTNFTGGSVKVCGDANLDYNWWNAPVLQLDSANFFSARFTKTQNFTQGNKRFKVRADNWAKVYIDGELIIDTSGKPALKTYYADKFVNAGARVIRVDMVESIEVAKVKLVIE